MSFQPGSTLIAIQDFTPSNFDDLELHPGDLVVVEPLDETDQAKIPLGYLKVSTLATTQNGINRHLGPNNGKIGYFPSNVVQLEEQIPRSQSASSGGDQPLSYGASSAGSVFSTSQQNFTQPAPLSEQNSQLTASSYQMLTGDEQAEYIKQLEAQVQVGSKIKVLYPYNATKADELELNLNDIIVVTHCPPGGWWRGAYYTESGLGKVGWFPCNFVQILPEEELISPTQTLKSNSARSKKSLTLSDAESASNSKSITRFWKKRHSKTPSVSDIKFSTGNLQSQPIQDSTKSANLLVNLQLDDPISLKDDPDGSSSLQSSASEVNLRKSKTSSAHSFHGGSSVLSSLTKKISGSPLTDMLIQMDGIEAPKRPSKKSWKDGISPELIDNMSATEIKKQQVMWELYVTEAAYVRDLKMIVDVFMKPMAEKKIVSGKIHETIFGNLNSILKTNYAFFKALSGQYEQSPTLDDFGFFFTPIVDSFFVYASYCNNNAKALAKVKDLTSSNKSFKQFLQEAYQNEATRHLDISSFLIKPMQRICKYPLLLMEIVKNTPVGHHDRRNLEIALAKLQSVIISVNEGVDGLQKINEIQNSFSEKINIISPTRYFVREDACSILLPPPDSRTKPRILYLFNDMLILAKKDWREKNHVIENALVPYIDIVDLQSDSSKFMMELKTKIPGASPSPPYLIVFNSKSQKEAWMNSWKTICSNFDPSTSTRKQASNQSLADTRSLSTVDVSLRSQPIFSAGASQSNQSIHLVKAPEMVEQRNSLAVDTSDQINTAAQRLSLPAPPQKPNSSQYDLSGTLKRSRSRRSVISLEARSRPRSHSFNDGNRQHAQIAKEVLDKHGPIMISKAQSLADIQNPDVYNDEAMAPAESRASFMFENASERSSFVGSVMAPSEMVPSRPMSTLSISYTPDDYTTGQYYESDIQNMRNELQTRQEEADSYQRVTDQINLELHETEEKLNETLRENDDLKNQLFQLKNELETVCKESKSTVANLQSEIIDKNGHFEQVLKNYEKEKVELKKKCSKLESDKVKADEMVYQLNSKVDSMKSETINLLKEKDVLKNSESSLLKENEILKSKLTELQATKNDDLIQAESVISDLKKRIEEIEKTKPLASSKKRLYTYSMETVQNPSKESATNLRKSNPVLTSHEYKIPSAQLLLRIEELEKENESLRQKDATGKVGRKDSMGVEIQRLNQKVGSLSKELENERASLNELRSSAQNLSDKDGHLTMPLFSMPDISTTEGRMASIDRNTLNAGCQTDYLVIEVDCQTDFSVFKQHPEYLRVVGLCDEMKKACESQLDEMNLHLKKTKEKYEKERENVQKLNIELDNLNKKLVDLQNTGCSSCPLLKTQADSMKAEILMLKNQLATSNTRTEELKTNQSHFELTEKLESLTAKCSLLQVEFSKANDENGTLTEIQRELQNKCLKLQTENDRLSAEINGVQESRRSSLSAADQAINEMKKELEIHKSKISSLQSQIEFLQIEISSKDKLLEDMQRSSFLAADTDNSLNENQISKIKDYEKEVGSLMQSQDKLSISIHDSEMHQVKAKSLETEPETLQNEICSKEKRLSVTQESKDQELMQLKEELKESSSKLTNLQSILNDERQNHDWLLIETQRLKESIKGYEQELQESDLNTCELRDQLAKAAVSTMEHEKQMSRTVESHQSEVTLLHQEIQSLTSRCLNLEHALLEASRVKSKSITDLSVQIKASPDLQIALAKLNEDSNKEINRLISMNEELQKKFSDKIHEYEIKIKDLQNDLVNDRAMNNELKAQIMKDNSIIDGFCDKENGYLEKLKFADDSLAIEGKSLQEAKAEIFILNEQICGLREALNEAEKYKDLFNKEIEKYAPLVESQADYEQQVLELQSTIENLQLKISDLEQSSIHDDEIIYLKNILGVIGGSSITDAARRLVSEHRALQKDTQNLFESFHALEQERNTLLEKISTIAESAANVEKTTHLENSIREKTTAYESLKKDMQSLMIDHEKLINLVDETERKASEEFQIAQKKISDLETTISKYKAEISQLKSSLTDYETKEAKLVFEKSNLNSQLIHLNARIEANTNAMLEKEAFYSKEIDIRDQKLRQIVQQHIPLVDYEDSCKTIDTLQKKVLDLKNELHNALLDLSDIRANFAEQSHQISRLDSANTKKDSEIQKLMVVIDDYKKHLVKMEEFYGETILNREKDIKSLKEEIQEMFRK